MGGGVSRLDETLWEAPKNEEEGDDVKCDNDNRKVSSSHPQPDASASVVASGGLDPASSHQTIDGSFPTKSYRNLELRKTATRLGFSQREYEIFDTTATTKTASGSGSGKLVCVTRSVAGTLAWFDVLGLDGWGSGGGNGNGNGNGTSNNYSNHVLRVRPLDRLRKTWIVYRYHHPVFEGQKPIDVNSDAFKGILDNGDSDSDNNVKLYKTACLTLSWSRYVMIAARYGPPDSMTDIPNNNNNNDGDNDGGDYETKHEEVEEEETNNEEGYFVHQTEPNTDWTNGTSKSHHSHYNEDDDEDDDDDEFITPRELLRLRENETSGGVEESKTECSFDINIGIDNSMNTDSGGTETETTSVEDSRSKHEQKQRSPPNARNNMILNKNCSNRNNNIRTALSISQTEKLRSYFGDDDTRRKAASSSTNSASSAAAVRDTKGLATTEETPPPSNNTIGDTAAADTKTRKEQQQQRQQPNTNEFLSSSFAILRNRLPVSLPFKPPVPGTAEHEQSKSSESSQVASPRDETEEESSQDRESLSVSSPRESSSSTKSAEAAVNINNTNNSKSGEGATTSVVGTNAKAAKSVEKHEANNEERDDYDNYEKAMEGVLDLDSDQPIVQCQEISNKMIGNHQTFNMTKEDLLSLLKLDQETKPPSQENVIRSGGGTPSENPLVPSQPDNLNPFEKGTTKAMALTTTTTTISSGWKWLSSTATNATKIAGHAVRSKMGTRADDEAFTTEATSTASSERESSVSEGRCATTTTTGATGTETVAEQQQLATKESSPGGGVEESKEEETSGQEDSGYRFNYDSTTEGKPSGKDTTDNDTDTGVGFQPLESKEHSEQPPPQQHQQHPPLVSYFFWKHTSLNPTKHKMLMHLSENSDLALHVVFAIVANQVRTERNHTVFLATGIHPSWLYIDPKNPRETIS